MAHNQRKHPRICLLTGPPGCGKTTLVQRLLESLAGIRVAGFMTAEIREDGRRQGFTAQSIGGSSCVMAHRRIRSRFRVGVYGVDVEAFDREVVEPLESSPTPDLFLIDEIGKMEQFSRRFVRLVERIAAGSGPFLATIPIRGSKLIEQLTQRDDALLVRMEQTDRAKTALALAAWCADQGFAVTNDQDWAGSYR